MRLAADGRSVGRSVGRPVGRMDCRSDDRSDDEMEPIHHVVDSDLARLEDHLFTNINASVNNSK